MGLDQYAFITTDTLKELNSHSNKRKNLAEIWYGRKINPLQGYFEDNYNIENCGFVEITSIIVEQIEEFAVNDLNTLNSVLTTEEQKYFETYFETDEYDLKMEKQIDDKIAQALFNNEQFFLKITLGLFYGNYNINYYYYLDLLCIRHFCSRIKQELENLHQDEKIVYSCWY